MKKAKSLKELLHPRKNELASSRKTKHEVDSPPLSPAGFDGLDMVAPDSFNNLPQKIQTTLELTLYEAEQDIIQRRQNWKMGMPVLATQEEINFNLIKIKQKHQAQKFLSLPTLPRTQKAIEQRVENKIAKARVNEQKFLKKLESIDSRSTAPPPHRLFGSMSTNSLVHFLELENTKPVAVKDSFKLVEVKARREKLQESQQEKTLQKYAARHENRRHRSSLMRSFECSKRLRAFLLIIYVNNFIKGVLRHKNSAKSSLGKLYQEQQAQQRKIAEIKEQLSKKKTTLHLQDKVRSRFLMLFIRWRLQKRLWNARLLVQFLKAVQLSACNVKLLFLRLKTEAQRLQRNIQALYHCKCARLQALSNKMDRVFQRLKTEAENAKKKHGSWILSTGDKLPHPRYNMDMNLTIEGETRSGMLQVYLDMRKKEWIALRDRQRRDARKVNCSAAQGWLTGNYNNKQEDYFSATSKSYLMQKYPYTYCSLYKETTTKEMLKLIQAIYEAKYPAQVAREKSLREHFRHQPQNNNDVHVLSATYPNRTGKLF